MPRIHIAVYGAYLVAALLITWPLLTVFSTRFIGHPFGDTYEYAGLIWWMKHAVQTGAPLFFQPLLAYPDGLSAAYLWSIPLQSFPAWFFALVMSLPAAFNLSILLTLALNGWSMFFLVSYLTRNRAAAFVSGLVFMAYPTFQGQLAAGHIGLLQQWAVPLLIYALLRLRESGERRWMIYGALFFVASLLGSSLNLIYVLFPVMAALIVSLLFRREWASLRRTILTIILGGLGSLIFLIPVLLEGAASPIRLSEGGTVAFSADLLAVVSPSFQNPLFSAIDYPHQVLGVDPFEKMAYVGIAAGLLALLALWRRPKARGWLLLALFAWILSLGPILKILDTPAHRVIEGYDTLVTLPWIAAQNLPLLNISRTPARFNFTVALAVAIMAGYGVSVLWDGIGHWRRTARYQPRLQWVVVILISALVLYEYPFFWTNGLPGMPTLPGSVPQPIADLAGQTNVRAVFDIPWDHLLTDKEAMFLQTGHEHPLLAGHIARRTPVDPAKLSLLQGTLDPALLNAAGADVVILHKQWDDAEGKTESFTRAKLGDPFYEDDDYAAFNVPKTDSTPVFTSVLSRDGVVTDHSDSYIYTPKPGWVMLTQTLDADWRLATLTVNGKQVYRWTVSGSTPVQAPLFLPQAGYYTVTLALEPPCPTIASPALSCNSLKVSDVLLGDLIPVEDTKSTVFANGLTLNAGYVDYREGGLSVWLDWFFDSARTETDIRFVHVLDADGKLVAQDDHTLGAQAAGGGWAESVSISLPTNLSAGSYKVYVGWYTYPDTTPFTILSDSTDAQNAQNGVLEIGTFSIS
ncbi:MAG: hypothetical protein ABI690_19185 [Chloroflexota bacterium]